MVIAYGLIATAVCVLVGPVFVPFLHRPQDGVALRGWFRCFIQYAFYQVIAAAVVYIIGNLHARRPSPPAGRHTLYCTINQLVSGPVYHLPRLDLRIVENPGAYQSHLSRYCGRIVGGAPGKGARMKNDASFEDAKRLYLEQYGDPMVTNTYLKIALVLVSLVALGLALVDLRTIRTFQNFRPLVIRIDDLDAPKPSTTTTLNTSRRTQRQSIFDPNSATFITAATATPFRMISRSPFTFSTASSPTGFSTLTAKMTSSRNSSPIPLRRRSMSRSRRLRSTEMQTPPFRARVDFYMVYYAPADHSELKRDLYTANFVFVFKSQVPNQLIPINPLGMTITYFREDEAFK